MRIRSLEISGFRGFAGSESFDLDAEAIVVVAANGQGKTSLFDAILWAITGQIPRLGGKDYNLISFFSTTGEARVSLTLATDSGSAFVVTRRFDGDEHHLTVDDNGTVLHGPAATASLLETLWPDSVATQNPVEALTAAFSRSVYLQQDLVRQFIDSDDEQDRFSVLSELCGAGRVVELQRELERSRNAWSRGTSSVQSELDRVRSRLESLETQLSRLQEGYRLDDAFTSEWAEWWQAADDLDAVEGAPPDVADTQAARRLDEVIALLGDYRQRAHRRLDVCTRLRDEIIEREGVPRLDTDAMRVELEAVRASTDQARSELTAAQGRAAEERRRQVEDADRNQELATLAQLALRHLDGRCPVCDQEHDEARTREHLEAYMASEPLVPTRTGSEVRELAARVEEREQSLADMQAKLQAAESSVREHALWEADRNRRLIELGLSAAPADDIPSALETLIAKESERYASLATLEEQGEALALRVARASESARRNELVEQVAEVKGEVDQKHLELRSRELTGELTGRIINQLREASLEVVSAQIEEIAPLIQRIYATADPHPVFRSVRLISRVFRGRGRLAAAIEDVVEGKTTKAPELVLSSSQMNALAVSVFLALNLGAPAVPLSSVMLDDPLQSLDDVNLLGLIDLLRRLSRRRQLIISTHDQRFGRLLERKLRPVSEAGRTRVIQLEGWSRYGPRVRQYDVRPDPHALRLTAA